MDELKQARNRILGAYRQAVQKAEEALNEAEEELDAAFTEMEAEEAALFTK